MRPTDLSTPYVVLNPGVLSMSYNRFMHKGRNNTP